MTMTLYCFGESGNSYKAALALELSGLDWVPMKVDFFGGETRSEAYRAQMNEMGEAPVLVDGATRLTQSGVIQSYVTEKTNMFGGYLFYFEPFGFERADWPGIDRWLAGIEALPGWKHRYDLMPGSPKDHQN